MSCQTLTSALTKISTCSSLSLNPVEIAEQRLVAGLDVEHFQHVEVARGFAAHQLVLVRQVDDRRIRPTAQKCGHAVRRARHVGAFAECDAHPVFDHVGDGIGAAAARMQQDRFAIQVLERAVFLRRHREELQLGKLEDDPQRRFGALHRRIGRAEADIHLAAQHGLNGQFLVRERGPFVVEAVGLGAVQRDEERRQFVRRRFGQRDPDCVGLGCRSGQADRPAAAPRPTAASLLQKTVSFVSSLRFGQSVCSIVVAPAFASPYCAGVCFLLVSTLQTAAPKPTRDASRMAAWAAVRVARLDGGSDPVVFGKAGMVARRAGRTAHHAVPGHGAADLVQLIEQRQQQNVVRGLGNGAVKGVVLRFVVVPVWCLDGAVARQLEPDDGLVGGIDRGLARDRRFQRKARAHQLYRRHLLAKLRKAASA